MLDMASQGPHFRTNWRNFGVYWTGQTQGVWARVKSSTRSLVNQSEKGSHMTQPRENLLWEGNVSRSTKPLVKETLEIIEYVFTRRIVHIARGDYFRSQKINQSLFYYKVLLKMVKMVDLHSKLSLRTLS